MKVLFIIACLVFVSIAPALGQTARLRDMYPPFSTQLPPVSTSLIGVIVMDPVTVVEKSEPLSLVRLNRELERRFNYRPDTGPVEIASDTTLLERRSEDMPVVGSFLGRSDEFRQLQGGFKFTFAGQPTTLYVKSGLRFRLSDDKNTTVVLRTSRFMSISVERKFRNQNDMFKPVTDFVTRLLK